jgi:enoyl-CoA hydratase
MHALRSLAEDPPALGSFMARLGALLDGLERAPYVNVAVVEGHAVAGGCELLLASDIVVAASDARIGDGHVEYGLAPAAGASVRLPRSVAPSLARYLLLTGELLSGADAAQQGLATISVEPDALEDEVDRIVARLRSRGRDTLKTVKAMLAEGHRAETAALLQRELDLFLEHITSSPDARLGLDAFHAGETASFDAGQRQHRRYSPTSGS